MRSISSSAIGAALDLEVYGGFVDLDTEDPAPAQALAKAELPDLSNGPHFFYGLQWWFFGLLAVFGFFYLLYDEWRGPDRNAPDGPADGYRARSIPPSTGSITPLTKPDAGDIRKAAARPNSAGSPYRRRGIESSARSVPRPHRPCSRRARHPLGADPPRKQPVDPDPARSEFVGQVLGDHREAGT